MAPERLSRRRYCCRYCGYDFPVWLPVVKRREASMLLYHLGQRHLEAVRPYLQRMETECIDAVLRELFAVVEEDQTR